MLGRSPNTFRRAQCHAYVTCIRHTGCVKRIERVRLYPTNRQQQRLQFVLDVTRQLYNGLLEERREAYRFRRVRVGTKEQYREITELRKIDARVAAVFRECQDAVLHRLDVAMMAFFRRLKQDNYKAGYPRFKAASRWRQIQFPHGGRALKLNVAQSKVTVPGIGAIRFRKGRAVPRFGRAWLVRKNERWYACFECEREQRALPSTGRMIGVDRGVHVLAAISDGALIDNKAFGERNRRIIAMHQQALEALTVRDSAGRVCNSDARREAAKLRLARAKEHEANCRRNHLHAAARKIVNNADVIVLERLALRAMTRSAKGTLNQPGSNVAAKAALNRRLLDTGFGQFARLIVEKAEEAARTVVAVDARFSSQTCSHCGHSAAGSRRRRRFICLACGFSAHADVNAALEILRRAQLGARRMPDAGEEPVAPPTRRKASTTKCLSSMVKRKASESGTTTGSD